MWNRRPSSPLPPSPQSLHKSCLIGRKPTTCESQLWKSKKVKLLFSCWHSAHLAGPPLKPVHGKVASRRPPPSTTTPPPGPPRLALTPSPLHVDQDQRQDLQQLVLYRSLSHPACWLFMREWFENSPPPSWWQQKTTICQYLKWSDHCPATMKHCFWAGSHHPPISLVVWPCCLKPVTTKIQPASQDMYNSVKMKSCPKNSNKPNLYESNPRPVNGPPNLRGFIGLCTIRPKLKIYFVVNAN